jgi:hypothetical protein
VSAGGIGACVWSVYMRTGVQIRVGSVVLE